MKLVKLLLEVVNALTSKRDFQQKRSSQTHENSYIMPFCRRI